MKNICIIGSRSLNKEVVFKKLDEYFKNRSKEGITFYSGGCRKGVDSYINEYYKNFVDSSFTEFKANWKKYGRAAGFVRNAELAKFMSAKENSKVIAVWDGISKGTEHHD